MSFSVEDVRVQLSKLGYENVPEAVIQKFMARMQAQQHQQQQQQPEQAHVTQHQQSAPSSTSSPYALPSSYTGHYTPAPLPPLPAAASPLSSQPLSSPLYSSLAQPVVQPPPQLHHVPSDRPLALRASPMGGQYGYMPPAQHQPSSSSYHSSPSAQPRATSTHSVTVEDASDDEEHASEKNEDEDEEDAYYRRKTREIEELEQRLKRHAAIAHGQKSILRTSNHSVAPASPSKENASPADLPPSSRTPSSQSGRVFGAPSRQVNAPIPAPSIHTAFPSKSPLLPIAELSEQAVRAHREARERESGRSAQQPPNAQPRSILRPSSAQLRKQASTQSLSSARSYDEPDYESEPVRAARSARTRPVSARSRPGHAAAEQDAGHHDELEADDIDTQRSLKKTYATSVQKYKRMNPRYGAGGYRKSDPVTRYQAYKSSWEQTAFLKKKTTLLPQGAKAIQPGRT